MSKSTVGYFWPEEEDGGGYIIELLDRNLKVISKKPSLFSKPKPCILFLAGHTRKSLHRDSMLADFFEYVSTHPTLSFVLLSTGWDTEKDQRCNPNIMRNLPPLPENCSLFTCRLTLSDFQVKEIQALLD